MGLSLIEVMIGLAIGSVLLVAVTSATRASIAISQSNQEYDRAVRTARTLVLQLAGSIRNSVEVSLASPFVTSGTTRWGNELLVATEVPGQTLPRVSSYAWSGTGTYARQLRYTPDTTADLTQPATRPRSVAANISNLSFQTHLTTKTYRDPVTKATVSRDVVTGVTIMITVTQGGATITLCETVAPRRELGAF
jgi:Tfp pilus assembly protein PilW